MELGGFRRADRRQLDSQQSKRLFKIMHLEYEQVLERVDRLRIDLAEVIGVDAGLLTTERRPQRIDVRRTDLFRR